MKVLAAFFLLVISVVVAAISSFTNIIVSASPSSAAMMADYQKEWEQYKIRFNKKYDSANEDSYRFRVFINRLPENNAALRKIQQENPHATFDPKLNPFADWTQTELDRRSNKRLAQKNKKTRGHHGETRRGFLTPRETSRLDTFMMRSAEERSVNWTAKGAVTYIKNQENCGSCWAFSTAACLEAQWFLNGHPLESFSPQQLVSCDTLDYGCDGSEDYSDTEKWIVHHNNGTIDTWNSWPYVSGDGKVPACHHNDGHHHVVGAYGIEGGKVIPSHEDEMNRVLVEEGPIQISIDSAVLQNYVGGVITTAKCHSSQVDHEVLITGVNNEHDPKYWIVKNSWAADWGEQGYFYVKKGSNEMCIAEWPFIWKIRK